MKAGALRVAILAVALLLAACAGQRPRPVAADAASLERQAAREGVLRAQGSDWRIEARLAVSDGGNSGSGSLDWIQQGEDFRFTVHAPVTGKTWVLSGGPGHAVLQGLASVPIEGAGASQLLERELGWHVPLPELVDWVRAMRAPGPAVIEFRPDGLPGRIEQAGWRVEYRDYAMEFDPPLPSRVFATRGEYSVRLAIRAWTLP
ncbi:MAG: outer membrane lipoprotein LolB [Xanthomonadales bacterium]|nr:outer membrane lipoprotein LolB [Xanthomonadales bacterium]